MSTATKKHLTLDDVAHIPHLGEPVTALFQRIELFAGIEPARQWFTQYGELTLKGQAHTVLGNLLGASSRERQLKGIMSLQRAIMAQAAWLQGFPVIGPPHGPIERLKKLTDSIRDFDSTAEEHEAAKTAFLEVFTVAGTKLAQAEKLLAQFTDFDSDFLFRAKAELYGWQAEAVEAVQQGKGARVAPKTLELTLERLRVLKTFHDREVAEEPEKLELIQQIESLAQEEAFIWAARSGDVSQFGKPKRLTDWQAECLDEVLAGRGAMVHLNTLRATARQLDFLSKLYFGEITPGNRGGKSKGRSPRKAAKALRDAKIRQDMRGAQGQKPGKGRKN